MTRRIRANGTMDVPVKLAPTSAARASGFPRAAIAGKSAYFAWTDPATKQIRIAKIDL
jgi:hypothetical protein